MTMDTLVHGTPAPRWVHRLTTLAAILGVLALLSVVAGGPLYRLGALGLGHAFAAVLYGAAVGAIALLAGVILLLANLRRGRATVRRRALVALLAGAVAFGPVAWLAHEAMSVPPIHDITTDTANPPQFRALLPAREKAPNGSAYGGAKIARQQHAAYPGIHPLQTDVPPSRVFPAALAAARAMGWHIAAADAAKGRIEATATTLWFGFKDDIVVRLTPTARGTRVDIRSDSRLGQSDLGTNARRVLAYSHRLEKRLDQPTNP